MNKKFFQNKTDEKISKFNEFLNSDMDSLINTKNIPIQQYLHPIYEKSNDQI